MSDHGESLKLIQDAEINKVCIRFKILKNDFVPSEPQLLGHVEWKVEKFSFTTKPNFQIFHKRGFIPIHGPMKSSAKTVDDIMGE